MSLTSDDLPWGTWLIYDYVRNSAYLNFLKNNAKDKIVVDCGAASGIWTWVALYYGAKHVFAIDRRRTAISHLTKIFADDSRVTVLDLDLFKDQLPVGDIYVHEIFDDNLFREGLLFFLNNCRRQNISQIYPNKIKLFSLTELSAIPLKSRGNIEYNFENLDNCLKKLINFISAKYEQNVDAASFISKLYNNKITANKQQIWEGNIFDLLDIPNINTDSEYVTWDAYLDDFSYPLLNKEFNGWSKGYISAKQFKYSLINYKLAAQRTLAKNALL